MYLYNYLIYNVHPFGVDKKGDRKLPRKLSLNEIINSSDIKSLSKHYRKHNVVHFLDPDEKY